MDGWNFEGSLVPQSLGQIPRNVGNVFEFVPEIYAGFFLNPSQCFFHCQALLSQLILPILTAPLVTIPYIFIFI